MKICKNCKVPKPFSDFYNDKMYADSHYPYCKICKSQYDKKYRELNKTKYSSKEYKEYNRERMKVYRHNNPELILLKGARSRAKRDTLPFNISIEDINIPKTCPILGIPIVLSSERMEKKYHSGSPSIDKIVPKLGYVKGNIQVISMRANIMKSNASLDELERFCTNILKLISNVRNSDNSIMDSGAIN